MLVVLDTNILLSFSISHRPPIQNVRDAWLTGKIDVAISDILMAEYLRVTGYKHLARYFQGTEQQDRIDELYDLGILIDITEPYPDAPDPDDRYLFAMLEHPSVTALITGDKALLQLETHNAKPILSPATFVKHYLGKQ